MLQAKSNNGNLVILATLTRKEIEKRRKEELFFCPTCGDQVIIKSGKKMIPHFAHRSKQNCSNSEKGEGPYHEKGKLLLYQWLKKQGLHVQLEMYIKDIKQRPDLLITIQQKRIAIEFQCSRIDSKQIQQRNLGYQRAGITPIWVLGANQFQRHSTYSVKIDEFTKQFIHKYSPECLPSIYYFCPNSLQFVLFQDLYFTRRGRAIGNLQFIPLQQITFKNLFDYQPLPGKMLYHLWGREKKSFRLIHPRRLFGQEKSWYQWLYNRGTHREWLPSIVYLPVLMQIQMNSPLWNWQSRICIDLIDKLSIGSAFSLNHCMHLLKGHWGNNTDYPLIQTNETAITQYLSTLEELRVIQEISPNYYVKLNSIKFHRHIEDALKSDKILISEMIRKSETNSKHNRVGFRYTK